MSKFKLLTITLVATLVIGLLGTAAVLAKGSTQIIDDPGKMPPGAVGSYTLNGEFHWIVPGGDIKIANFTGLTKAEIFKEIQMSPEDEAKIVHEVPPCPEIIIDGTAYKSEDIHKFDGQQLGFIVGNDGILYAFTTQEGFQNFKQTQMINAVPGNGSSGGIILSIDNIYSHYYWDWYCGGSVISLDYRYSLANLAFGWDNAISSLEVARSCNATRLYDYANFGGDYFEALAGTTYNVLLFQGWNDRASSILHY